MTRDEMDVLIREAWHKLGLDVWRTAYICDADHEIFIAGMRAAADLIDNPSALPISATGRLPYVIRAAADELAQVEKRGSG